MVTGADGELRAQHVDVGSAGSIIVAGARMDAEALKSIGANVSTTVASAVSVLIGMFLIGVFIGLGTWLVSWSDDKKRELAVHVYFCPPPSDVDPNPRCPREATTKEINAVRVHLASDDRIKEGGIRFISNEDAFKRMQKREPELTALVVTNPLPASFDVVPKRGEDTAAIALSVRNAVAPAPTGSRMMGILFSPAAITARSMAAMASKRAV